MIWPAPPPCSSSWPVMIFLMTWRCSPHSLTYFASLHDMLKAPSHILKCFSSQSDMLLLRYGHAATNKSTCSSSLPDMPLLITRHAPPHNLAFSFLQPDMLLRINCSCSQSDMLLLILCPDVLFIIWPNRLLLTTCDAPPYESTCSSSCCLVK